MAEGNWVTAWWGRGPLSTTITTDHTFVEPVPSLGGRTLRLVAHLTLGGTRLRVRLSQRFSAHPLRVARAGVAQTLHGGAIVPGSDLRLTFAGDPEAEVPAGGDLWSDPVDVLTTPGDLALSFYVPGPWVPTTQGARGETKTSYHAPGDQVSSPTLTDAVATRRVFLAFEVQVFSPVPAAALVALGDSITEGACGQVDANASWPELVGRRRPNWPDGRRVSVVNAGIGSGRWASSDGAGLRGLARLGELLTLPHVSWVVVHMGVNDISYEGVAADIVIEAFGQAIHQARRAGVALAVVPILPFGGSPKDRASNVATAQAVNAWLRSRDGRRGADDPCFDAVLDVEEALVAPGQGWSLRPDLTADGVHPNQAGYEVLAAAVDLAFNLPRVPAESRQ